MSTAPRKRNAWRKHETHAEETKAVKAALKAAKINAKVGHGSGTAWAWLEIDLGPMPRDEDERGQRARWAQGYYREITREALRIAREVTGRSGEHDGDILILTQGKGIAQTGKWDPENWRPAEPVEPPVRLAEVIPFPGRGAPQTPAHRLYRYGCQNRPPGIGTVPQGWTLEEHPDFRLGVVVYDEPLSEDQIRSYELVKIADPEDDATIVAGVAASLRPYGREWSQLAVGDPEWADTSVRYEVEKLNFWVDPARWPAIVERVKERQLAAALDEVRSQEETTARLRAQRAALPVAARQESDPLRGVVTEAARQAWLTEAESLKGRLDVLPHMLRDGQEDNLLYVITQANVARLHIDMVEPLRLLAQVREIVEGWEDLQTEESAAAPPSPSRPPFVRERGGQMRLFNPDRYAPDAFWGRMDALVARLPTLNDLAREARRLTEASRSQDDAGLAALRAGETPDEAAQSALAGEVEDLAWLIDHQDWTGPPEETPDRPLVRFPSSTEALRRDMARERRQGGASWGRHGNPAVEREGPLDAPVVASWRPMAGFTVAGRGAGPRSRAAKPLKAAGLRWDGRAKAWRLPGSEGWGFLDARLDDVHRLAAELTQAGVAARSEVVNVPRVVNPDGDDQRTPNRAPRPLTARDEASYSRMYDKVQRDYLVPRDRAAEFRAVIDAESGERGVQTTLLGGTEPMVEVLRSGDGFFSILAPDDAHGLFRRSAKRMGGREAKAGAPPPRPAGEQMRLFNPRAPSPFCVGPGGTGADGRQSPPGGGSDVRVSAQDLAVALWGPGGFEGLNAGVYPGTTTPVRQIRPDAVLTIHERGDYPHQVEDEDGGWIAERFSIFTTPRLGEREYRRALAALGARTPNPPGYPGSGVVCEDSGGREVACDAKGARESDRVLYRPRLPDGSRPRVYLRRPVDYYEDLQRARSELAAGRDPALDEATARSQQPELARDALGGYEGAETRVLTATAAGCPARSNARYRVVEASQLVASHDPVDFSRSPAYPEGIQERQYHRDRSEQIKVIQQAQCLRPELLINDNPDAINGPPVCTPAGIVLGGNSRTMTAQRVYRTDPDGAKVLRDYLGTHARDYGLTPAVVRRLSEPVLVRVVHPDDPSPAGLRELVRRYNEALTQRMDPAAEQVAVSGRVDEGVLASLAEGLEPGETLTSFLTTSRSRSFVAALQRSGLIDRRSFSALVDDRTGLLNEDGRTFVARALVGRLVPDPTLLDALGTAVRDNLSASVPSLYRAAAAGRPWDLTPHLLPAARLYQEMRRAGYQVRPGTADEVAMFLGQHGADIERAAAGQTEAVPEPVVLLLRALVERPGPRQLPQGFRRYAETASQYPEGQAGFLPPPTLREAFLAAFGLEGAP